MAAGGRPPLVCLAVLVLFSVNISAALTHHPSQCRENGRFDDDCCAERKAMACANGYKLRRSDMCCFKIVVCFAYKYRVLLQCSPEDLLLRRRSAAICCVQDCVLRYKPAERSAQVRSERRLARVGVSEGSGELA